MSPVIRIAMAPPAAASKGIMIARRLPRHSDLTSANSAFVALFAVRLKIVYSLIQPFFQTFHSLFQNAGITLKVRNFLRDHLLVVSPALHLYVSFPALSSHFHIARFA